MRGLIRQANDESAQIGVLPQFLQPPVPSIFTLEITRRCHHHCVGCGNIFTHLNEEMDKAEWVHIIERIRPNIQALRITGGEPTLHHEFADLLTYIDTLSVPFVIFTNGNWLDPHKTVRFLCTCKNLQGILISVCGANPEEYRKFAKVDAFTHVIQNIKHAVDSGLRVTTNTLLLRTTFDKIREISDQILALGVSAVSFGRYYGPPLPELSLTPHQLASALIQINTIRRHNPRVTLSNCIPTCFLPELSLAGRGCTSGFTHCTIGPEGNVRPCTHTPLVLGRIQDKEIKTLWRSPELKAWRDQVPENCRACEALNQCRGGCRATAQQLGITQDPLMREPFKEVPGKPVIELALQDRPKLTCTVESTEYGYALTGAGSFITLTQKCKPILDALKGDLTVQEIGDRYGRVGLQLVGSLFRRRMIEFR